MFSSKKKAADKGKKPVEHEDDRWSKFAEKSYNNHNNNTGNESNNGWKNNPRYAWPGKSEDSHYAQTRRSVEAAKNRQFWYEHHVHWNYDAQKMQENWQWQRNMELEDIHHHLLHGDGEEVVWQDDVWGLQQHTEVPPNPPNRHANPHADKANRRK